MKFTSTLLALGIATGVISSPAMERRDPAALAAAIATIAADIAQFDSDVNAYTGGPPTTIQSDSDTIVADTQAAVTLITAQDSLSTAEVLAIIVPVQHLNTSINQAIDDLIAKKDLLVAACFGIQTLDDLNQQLDTATTLSNSIADRVPAALKPTALQLSAPILAAINKGITAFTGITPCPTSTSSSASATATATATASATATATATGSSTEGTGSATNGGSYPTETESSGHDATCTSLPGYPTGGNNPYPTGGEQPYPTGGEQPYPTGGEQPYPTGGEQPYPTGGEQPYPTGGEQPYPTGGEQPYPTGGHQPYPTGGAPTYTNAGPSATPTLPPITNGAASFSAPLGVIIAIAAVMAF